MEVVRRFLQPPSGSFFLFGPRGTGKSTWLQEWFGDDALLLDLLDPSQLRAYLAQPERLRQRIACRTQPHRRGGG
jgi:predicted AAA+ superfamily ATPase